MKEGSDACFISLLFGKNGAWYISIQSGGHTVDLAWQRQQHQHQTVKTQVQEKSNRKKEVCICRARRVTNSKQREQTNGCHH